MVKLPSKIWELLFPKIPVFFWGLRSSGSRRCVIAALLLFRLGGEAMAGDSGLASSSELPKIEVKAKRPRTEPEEPTEFSGERWEVDSTVTSSVSQVMRRSAALQLREQGGEGNAPVVGIRGMDPIQTRFFLEGIPLSDAEFNSSMIHLLPPEVLGSVEVFPEGVPTRYAEDGLGGAIQFKLTRPGSAKTSLGTRLGSFRFANVFGVVPSGDWQWHFDYRQSQEDFAYFDDNGTPYNPNDNQIVPRQNNDFYRVTVLPQWSILDEKERKWFAFSLNSLNRTGTPGSIRSPTRAKLAQGYHLSGIHFTQHNTDAVIYFRLAHDELTNKEPTQGVAPPSFSRAYALGLRATQKLGSFHFTSGLSWEDFLSEQIVTGERKSNQRGALPLGGHWELSGESWSLTPALLGHFYHYQLKSAGSLQAVGLSRPYRNYFLLSPRVGMKLQLSQSLQWRTSLGSYYRAPTLSELYGAPYGISASTQLVPERAEKVDLGWDWSVKEPFSWLRLIRVSYTGGVSFAHQLISYLQSSAMTRTAVNIGESRILFQEVAVEGRLKESAWWWQFTLSWLGAINLSDVSYQYGKELPNRPSYRSEMHLGYEGTQWRGGYRFSWAGPTYWDLGNFKRRQALSEHGAYLGWNTKRWGEFAVEARNIFDSITSISQMDGWEFTDNTTGYLGYPQPGRRLYFTWKTSF